jgi:hypothetical protein
MIPIIHGKMTARISEALKEIDKVVSNPQVRWELLKYEIRKFTRSFSKVKARKFKGTLKLLEEKITETENIPNWEKDEILVKRYNDLKLRLDKHHSYI